MPHSPPPSAERAAQAAAAPAPATPSGAAAAGTFRVAVTKDYLVFASAHFITFRGHRCEPLHGHNYRVAVSVEGALDPEGWYVVDFGELKRITRALCNEIDHKVLLPAANPLLAVERAGDQVRVAHAGAPRYVFPAEDCAILPIPNTTAEMLAQHLAGRVRDALRASGAATLTAIELEVEESVGQGATYRERLGQGPARERDPA